MTRCILCEAKATRTVQESASRSIYNCSCCGVYVISDLVVNQVRHDAYKLAAFFANRKLAGYNEVVLVTYDKAKKDKDYLQLTVEQITEKYPQSFSEQMDCILQNLSMLSEYGGAEIKVESLEMAPVFYLDKVNYDALSFVIKSMHKADLIEVNYYGSSFFPCSVIVSPKGWDRISQLRSGQVSMDNAMVLAQNEECGELYRQVAQKAIKECGYQMLDCAMDSVGQVDFGLIAAIKSSNFLIVDLTGAPGSAYYSIGMATALKKPVILTCHEKAREKLHVDTSQICVLSWSEEKDLYLHIQSAIRALL